MKLIMVGEIILFNLKGAYNIKEKHITFKNSQNKKINIKK